MSSVNVNVGLGPIDWVQIDTQFPVTLTFADTVRITLGGDRLRDRANWLRLTADRLIAAAEQVDADIAQRERDLAATKADLERLRRSAP